MNWTKIRNWSIKCWIGMGKRWLAYRRKYKRSREIFKNWNWIFRRSGKMIRWLDYQNRLNINYMALRTIIRKRSKRGRNRIKVPFKRWCIGKAKILTISGRSCTWNRMRFTGWRFRLMSWGRRQGGWSRMPRSMPAPTQVTWII